MQASHNPASRRNFLQWSGLGVAAAAAVPTMFCQEAHAAGPSSQTVRNFRDIQRHENDHVGFLLTALGSAARPEPNFMNLLQRNYQAFVNIAQVFENTGVGAYLGAAPVIDSREILAQAGSIALIEGRHAGWLNTLQLDPITLNVFGEEQSFERALTIDEVVALVSPFIEDLNGGPPLTFSSTPSPENDIAILNFALALEFLEAEFYNLNVPKFAPPPRGRSTSTGNPRSIPRR